MNGLVQLKKTNLYEQAIDSLLNYIIANDLKEGDRLPPENQLKDIFGISRNTLREAIKSLQLIGLIETKQKSGIVVKNFSIADLTKFVPYALNVEDKELKKLLEVREWMEYSLLPMIIEKRTEENLEKIAGIVQATDEALARKEDIQELDFEFHKALVECCDNPFIENMSIILREFFSLYMKLNGLAEPSGPSDEVMEMHRATSEEHKIIFKCIEERNLPRLQKIYKKHLSKYNLPLSSEPT